MSKYVCNTSIVKRTTKQYIVKEICKKNCVVSNRVTVMVRALMEVVPTYNRSMYKNRHINRKNNKINIFI